MSTLRAAAEDIEGLGFWRTEAGTSTALMADSLLMLVQDGASVGCAAPISASSGGSRNAIHCACSHAPGVRF